MMSTFPFFLEHEEAQNISRVLVEQDKGKGSYMELEGVQDINVITHRMNDIVGKYEIQSNQKPKGNGEIYFK